MKKRSKYENFILVRPSGEVEKIKVPTFFDVRDVAGKLRHSEIFMEVRKGFNVGSANGLVRGKAAVYFSRKHDDWIEVPKLPENDREAVRILNSVDYYSN